MSRLTKAGISVLVLLTAAPAFAQVQTSALDQVDSWGTGWLGKGEALPSNLWANTTTAALQPLFADAKPLQLAPSAREALKRVALSAAKGPANGDALIPERLRIIEQLGFTQYSIDLRKRFPSTEWGKLGERVAADYELVQGQSKSACARAADKKGNDEAWMSMRAFCFALAKDFNAAGLAAEHLPPAADGKSDGWLLAAINTLETPGKVKPEGRYGTAFEAAVSVTAKLSVPVNAFAATPADVAASVINHPDASPEQKRAALKPALDGGKINAAQVLEILNPKPVTTDAPADPKADPKAAALAKLPAPRAGARPDFLALALATAANKEAKPDAKATAYAAALKDAETLSDFRLAAVALNDAIKALPKTADTAPNAETFARVGVLAGDTKAAQDWKKQMDGLPKDKADPWAAARIELMLSYSGVGADKGGAVLDKLIAAVPAAPDVAVKATTPAARQAELRRIENTRFLFLHAGMGRDLSAAQRTLLATLKAAGRGLSDAALARIAAAVEQEARGEAAMASIPLLGNDVSAVSFAGLADLLTQMRRMGLADDANAVALESLQVWKAL
ncbi:MAG TPA: hypothetical protein VGO52_14655 [Hyphomonadaceae bacterium]|jgi:hypothetical protein|nr:hypothetical protein [Hyphomonadaceae bacterium]